MAVRKIDTIKIRRTCMKPLQQLSLRDPLHVSCPMLLIRRAIKAVTQKMAAIKKTIAASVCVGNTKIVGEALKVNSCVKRRRLVRARD